VKKTIGYRIRKLREQKDYSQGNMAAELGITPGAYAKIERGETDPSVTRLIQIAGILEVDVASFFRESVTPEFNSLTESVTSQTPSTVTRAEFNRVVEALNSLKAELEIIRKHLPTL
jgi:transcriptional regulator with XRE-family HTH domain